MKEELKNAICKTSEKYGKNQSKYAVYELLTKRNAHGFTNSNGGYRDLMLKMKVEEVESELTSEYLTSVLNSKKGPQNPLEKAIYTTYEKYKADLRGVGYILQTCLKEALHGNYMFPVNGTDKNLLLGSAKEERLTVSQYVASRISDKVVENIAEKQKAQTISNVQTYPNNMNKLKSAILSGVNLQYSQMDREIAVGNLYAVSNIGNRRKNQEDAALLVEHPKNSEFKMLAVADGMGGLEAGEKASTYTVNQMREWFQNIPKEYFDRPEYLQPYISEKLTQISQNINDNISGKSGTTFVGAIVGKDTTLVINVGDSRAYAVKNGELSQITKDQSVAWIKYRMGEIRKDDMRFLKGSNVITQCIGDGEKIHPEFEILNNKDYDTILLFSDGVTDCLSDERIKAVCKNTDRKKLAKAIVAQAKNTNSIVRDELKGNPDYNEFISAGKDNITAVQYTKNEDERY